MKKKVFLAVIAAACISLSGCGGQQTEKTESSAPAVKKETEPAAVSETTAGTTAASETTEQTTEAQEETAVEYEYFDNDTGVTLTMYIGSDSNIEIPSVIGGKAVTALDSGFATGHDGITSVVIPDSVKVIGGSAFRGCENLAEVTIPDSVEEIGGFAFFMTPWLESKKAEDPLVIVNGLLIDGKSASGSAAVPDGVSVITEYAFYDSEITDVSIPDGVKFIGNGAFFSCKGLTGAVIPDGVSVIGGEAFAFCESLADVALPDGIESFGEAVFDNCKNVQVSYKGETYGYDRIDELYAAING